MNPPHLSDYSVLARLANIGIIAGEDSDISRFDSEETAALEAGAKAAQAAFFPSIASMGSNTNGWTTYRDGIGVDGNDYLKRAVVTLIGLGANPPEDAIHPLLVADSDGETTTGDTDYRIRFDADSLPPVFAFWSVTMYDTEGFQVANELNRHAIGDRDPRVYNDHGSLDLCFQHANPGSYREPNWPPAPHGVVGVTLRLYAPKPEALDGRWSPPPVTRPGSVHRFTEFEEPHRAEAGDQEDVRPHAQAGVRAADRARQGAGERIRGRR